jgi:hypothetical protein
LKSLNAVPPRSRAVSATPAKYVALVEAVDESAAIGAAAEQFKLDPKRLIAVRRA